MADPPVVEQPLGIPATLEHGQIVVPAAGRRQLAKERQAWDRMAGIIRTVLHGDA